MTEKKTTSKKLPPATQAKSDPDQYRIKAEEWGFTRGDTQSQVLAALTTRSALTATTYKAYAGAGDELEVGDLMSELRKAGEEVAGGDMSRIEKMLAHQALTLDAIFNNMALRSSKQDTFKGIEVLMRLALKAQAQARSTAEALALLKNPQPYIRQANMTTGPQQVNNAYVGAPSNSVMQSGAGNIQSEQNKLMEATDGNCLDTRAQGAASRVDSHMATVGEVHRAKVAGRQRAVE